MNNNVENTQAPEEFLWVLIGEKARNNYNQYGLLPLKVRNTNDECSFLLPIEGPVETLIYAGFINNPGLEGSYQFIDNLGHKLNIWWKAQPEHIKRAFSVFPSYELSWSKYPLMLKMGIYNYCIIKENGIDTAPDTLRSMVMDMTCDLSDFALEYINGKDVETMSDNEGGFLEKYQEQFNRIYDDIESLITGIEF